MRSFSLCAPVSIEIEACRRTGLLAEEVRQGQKVNVISFSLPTSGMVFSRSLGDF